MLGESEDRVTCYPESFPDLHICLKTSVPIRRPNSIATWGPVLALFLIL